jgi:ADP-ribosyl-[dinitrogen reductase] hydrolase
MTDAPDRQQRARGALLGLACGDALGRPVEFMTADRISATHGTVREMLGDGTHGQPPGTITDDTEMALCIARSLAAHGEFVPADIADRFVSWLESGPFDVGLMTKDAVDRLREGAAWDEAGRAVWESRPEGQNAGNGSLMRCVPYALAVHESPAKLVSISRDSSRITHADPRCQWGCAILNLTVSGVLTGRDAPLRWALDACRDAPAELHDACAAVEAVVSGRRAATDLEPTLRSSGYVVHTLQTALFEAFTADDAETAIVSAVNRGNDTDTVGAVTGAIAGARFGVDALPQRWLGALDHRAELDSLATTLVERPTAE